VLERRPNNRIRDGIKAFRKIKLKAGKATALVITRKKVKIEVTIETGGTATLTKNEL